jgi:hypothetical protein
MNNKSQPNDTIVYGFKFLNALGATEGRDMPGAPHKRGQNPATYYPLPQPGEKWGAMLTHPEPEFDHADCGSGRFHIMNKLDARYAPANWWPWFARGCGVAGSSDEKTGVVSIQLRRIRPEVFWRMMRLGWCKSANLYGARNLDEAFGVNASLLEEWKKASE